MELSIGMMWFDNDPKKATTAKIIEAGVYFTAKYGRVPNACTTHTGQGVSEKVNEMKVTESRSILPNCFWIGVES